MTSEDRKLLAVVGTSGSTDYLRDATGDQRFWPVVPPPGGTADGAETCDGIHDEGAPPQYLCTRCFPGAARGDLAEHEDDDCDGVRRDEEQEME